MKKRISAAEKKTIKTLKRKCYHLWNQLVKIRAGFKCEICKKTKYLNSHHIENFVTNRYLRYDPRNGFCGCPSHHKFGEKSAHRSFMFMLIHMIEKRPDDLIYLAKKISTPNKPKMDIQYYMKTIETLEYLIKREQ